MKVAIVKRISTGKNVEIKNVDINKLMATFDGFRDIDIYGGFEATKDGNDYYVTIINYQDDDYSQTINQMLAGSINS